MFQYPYGDTQQLNLDWLMEQWQETKASIDGSLQGEIDRVEAAITDLLTARDQAVAAKTAAETAATSASGYAGTASTAASTATAQATAAAGSAALAGTHASNAQTSETNAGLQATAAGNSAAAAAVSAGNASNSEGAAAASSSAAAGNALYAEGMAKGTQNGTPVASDSPYYENNAAYWAGEAQSHASNAIAASYYSEAMAKGTVNGTPVASGDPGYEDNAEYYKDQAAASAASADGTNAQKMIAAPEEATSTAAAAHAAGTYFRYNSKLYKATQDIAIGNTITPNTNCVEDTVCAELTAQSEQIGEIYPFYNGGYELGKISQVTGNNNSSSSYVRTTGFLDNTKTWIIDFKNVNGQIFEYLADGTFNNYYLNVSPTNNASTVHNAIAVDKNQIIINASESYKYRMNFFYADSSTISDIDTFVHNLNLYHLIKGVNQLEEIAYRMALELENPSIKHSLAVFGDSLTATTTYYATDIRTLLQIPTLYNRGIAGACLAENSVSDAGANSSVAYRIVNNVNFPDGAEIIMIFAGLNDYICGTPIGDWSSNDITSIYGAMISICETLAALDSNPKIAFMTPTKTAASQKATALDPTTTQDAIRTAIMDVAAHYGYPVIDLGGICGINEVNAVKNTNPTTSDGTHWSDEGKAMCQPIIADGIRALYQK